MSMLLSIIVCFHQSLERHHCYY